MAKFSLSDREGEWKKEIITPKIAACGLVESPDRTSLILIKRKYPPHGLAFPGGMVEIGETLEETAKREILEETGVKAQALSLLSVHSDPKQDPRWHVVIVYILMRAEEDVDPKGMDDALEAFWMPYNSDELLEGFVESSKTALKEYRNWREKEIGLTEIR